MRKWLLGLGLCLQSALMPSWADEIVLSDGTVYVWAKVAKTPEERARGLMFRPYLLPFQGMLFVFEKEEEVSFWMKNTMIPLQMRFYDTRFHLVHAVLEAKPCYQMPCLHYPSQKPTRYVLETRAIRPYIEPNALQRFWAVHYRQE
ncbi:MAG: DUF192 domain-containing protein [Cardiobacteriaceae bacterium]|nr:DUF192 domain-containing protein [Cardiobacteriaceae bacterium]